MKSIINSTVLLSFMLILFLGCNRKSDVLIGTWEMDVSYVNGVREKENYPLTLYLFDDGTFRQVIQYPSRTEDVKGDWVYSASEKLLNFKYTYTGTDVKWTVVKFDKDKMELSHKTQGFFVERTFVKKE
jgi:hypothetical protein